MNTQKKQLIIATISVLIFCAVMITGLFLIPALPSGATSDDGDDNATMPATPQIVAPQPVDGLVYNGRRQALITAGQDDITYSLTADGEFTDKIPTAVDAGVYFIYYKVADSDAVYSLYSAIAQKERTVSCTMENWNYNQTTGEPIIALSEKDGTTEPQITYYQNGRKLYRKPTAVGQYTVQVSIPASTNYQACTAQANFTITSQIELLFDASLAQYGTVTITLGTQTQTVDLTMYGRTIIFNALNGAQTLTVTANGTEICKRVINADENQQIKVMKG